MLAATMEREISGRSAPAMFPDLKQNQDGEELRVRDGTGVAWEQAPAGSHVDAFRHYDARKLRLFRLQGRPSEIHVRFNDGSEYAYYIADHDAAANIYAIMAVDAHPGAVIHRLLKGRYPYKQLVARRK